VQRVVVAANPEKPIERRTVRSLRDSAGALR
jgi:hypothetical protein